MMKSTVVLATLGCLFGIVLCQGHDHSHTSGRGHNDLQKAAHSTSNHGNTDGNQGHRTSHGQGRHDRTHIDMPGEHGNTAAHPVVHRPGTGHDHGHGHGPGDVHVDMPGEHGNTAAHPVIHRPGSEQDHGHGHRPGDVHVDRPGEHGNNTPFNVVHRPEVSSGTSHGTSHDTSHDTSHGASHDTSHHDHGHGPSDVHVGRPGEHGTSHGTPHGTSHGTSHGTLPNTLPGTLRGTLPGTLPGTLRGTLPGSLGHNQQTHQQRITSPGIDFLTPAGPLQMVRPDMYPFMPVNGGPFLYPVGLPPYIPYTPPLMGAYPGVYPRSHVYPHGLPMPVGYPGYPVSPIGGLRRGRWYRRQGMSLMPSTSPLLFTGLFNVARTIG